MDNYYQKYIKYKNKYLQLKDKNNLIGGRIINPEILDSLKNKKIIWFTMVNSGYVDFVINFSIYANPLNFSLIVFCLDDESFNTLKNIYICIRVNFNKKFSKELEKFGDLKYKIIVFQKLDAINYALELFKNLNKPIGYIDTDIILFKNPDNYIFNLMEKYQDIDVFTQCDEGTRFKECSNRNLCPNLCSGVLVIRNSANLSDALKYTDEDLIKFNGDQDYLSNQLDKLNIKRYTFSRFLMPNGAFFKLQNVIKDDLPKPDFKIALLIHFNYLYALDKITVMKKWEFWNQKEIDDIKYIFKL